MLTGLLSFMLESAATTGAVNAPKAERQRYSPAKLAYTSLLSTPAC